MKSYTLIAPAKINLYLEIVGDRVDGFHELVMILQSIELADRVTITPNQIPAFQVRCDRVELADEKQNLAYKAAQIMRQEFPEEFANWGGADILLEKQIPIAAGLAGGSTDAAAVLVGLNLIWNLGLTQPELQDLGAQLGSDVPFCLLGGTAIATGRGEILDPIISPHGLWVVLAKHENLAVSTPWAYQTYRQQFGHTYLKDASEMESRATQLHSSPLMEAIAHNDTVKIAQNLYNDLEKVVLPEYPQVQKLKESFQNASVLGTMMSGSGPTVFALCESRQEAERVKTKVATEMADAAIGFWITQLSGNGISIQ
ncbi:4-(cytidine 5'-diphospho)-2-C-methyl-D-erythritol kinase [Spirulina sp. 06S082]|uniref:4-(cytidine 5'-diphospho)-2-C-methyl-D-erythritol kinase n=1 Tax=Spirulina sp. 06S082 TaxID=3110248 RepID=UPI002B213945|nr:4-(cytidine 5'-diphospho)-2-C-methyl-D-erythritol kinase [Spirulina sp. 06S082]MEA5468132.1 4-(cytidine 5'-diphospho)-2-C-methyl-D-erythritol kinase [Spirulina sp. 06S082]